MSDEPPKVEPLGYELREARSDRSARGRDWKPADALYAASQEISGDTELLAVVWGKSHPNGTVSFHFRYAGPPYGISALALELGKW